MNEHDVERLGVVSLETLDDEEDTPPVHVTESETRHVKDHDNLVDGTGEERPVGLHLEDDKVLEGLGGLIERPVLGDVNVAVEEKASVCWRKEGDCEDEHDGSTVSVSSLGVSLSRVHLTNESIGGRHAFLSLLEDLLDVTS